MFARESFTAPAPSSVVNLVNVFALLSLLAVGGGTAVLPQMKHDVAVTHG